MEAITILLEEQSEQYNKTRKYEHLLKWYEILKLVKEVKENQTLKTKPKGEVKQMNIIQKLCDKVTSHKYRSLYACDEAKTEFYWKCKICGYRFYNNKKR